VVAERYESRVASSFVLSERAVPLEAAVLISRAIADVAAVGIDWPRGTKASAAFAAWSAARSHGESARGPRDHDGEGGVQMTKRHWMNGLMAAVSITGVLTASGVTATVGDFRSVAFPASKSEKGQVLYAQVCRSCHATEPDKNKAGPSLFGVVGRSAGAANSFDYSGAMKEVGLTWNDETLDRYLADPKNFVPGNRMPYSLLMGPQNEERRKSVIAYLHTLE
jgi:cytochrome c